MANLTTMGGFKTYTTVTAIVAVIGLIVTLVGSWILPTL
jgi:hypothetical protein